MILRKDKMHNTCATSARGSHLLGASSSCHGLRALAPQPLCALLDQHSLPIEDRESLLETCDLSRTALLPFGVRLRHGSALLQQRCQILVHCIELRLDTRAVSRSLRHCLVEIGKFLCLVFHILRLSRFVYLVVLGLLLISTRRALLCRHDFCKLFGKVGFNHLQEADDALTRTLSCSMGLVVLSIIIS